MPDKAHASSSTNHTQDIDQDDPIHLASMIAQRYMQSDIEQPVNPFKSPDELKSTLDLSIGQLGESSGKVLESLEALVQATPRSTSKRFYNQLFGGRDQIATAADMLVPVLNTSLYTFKAAGPMAIIEEIVIDRMAQKLGFDTPGPQGVFTPGGSISNLLAMLIARNQACPNLRNEGFGSNRITCYVSQDAHYSVVKNAGILGMGRDNVRLIPTNKAGQLEPQSLCEAILQDKQSGCIPSIVIATAGTTVLGSFDPIQECATIAQEYGIWFHVDASFGGSAAMSSTHKHLLAGIEQADSVAWNPHKVMGVPLSAAAFITRKPDTLRKSLDETADYLFQGDDDTYNPGTRSIQCGRRNDALKVWAAWKHHGDEGYQDRIDHLMNLAQHCAQFITDHDYFTLTRNPEFVNVCFEVIGKSSKDICDALREQNQLLVGHATVDSRRIIRVPFVNADLTTNDVEEMLGLILKVADSLPAGSNTVTASEQCQSKECCSP